MSPTICVDMSYESENNFTSGTQSNESSKGKYLLKFYYYYFFCEKCVRFTVGFKKSLCFNAVQCLNAYALSIHLIKNFLTCETCMTDDVTKFFVQF